MRLAFVELRVRDVDAAVAWYRDVLGLELLMRDETSGFALLRAGDGQVALKAGEPTPGGALLAFEVDDLDAWVVRLEEKGVRLDDPLKDSPEGYRRARLRDRDGHPFTLFQWRRDR